MVNEKVQKQRYVPKGAIKVQSKLSPTVAYLYELVGVPYVYLYVGNAIKPAAFYRFKTVEARAAYVTKFMQEQDVAYAAKQARKAEKAAKLAEPQKFLKVGDVLMCMWGYDQTNVDYFEVVELKGKRNVVIREIGCESVETEFMQGKSVPAKGNYIGEPMLKKVNEYGGVRIYSFATASKLEPVAVVAGKEIYPATSWTAYA